MSAPLIEKLQIILQMNHKITVKRLYLYGYMGTYYSMIAWRHHTTIQWVKAATNQSLQTGRV